MLLNRIGPLWGPAASCALLILAVAAPKALSQESGTNEFSFCVAGDMRHYLGPGKPGKRYFDGACEAMKTAGPGAFLISPGDCDPPEAVRAVIDQYLGTNFLWFPIVGNHDLEKPGSLEWLGRWAERGIPHLVRRGPTGAEGTTYSFDFGPCHLVAINDYYNGKAIAARQDVVADEVLEWLEKDLAATDKPLRFVFGHKPLQSLPDMDSGRVRHGGESISTNAANLDKFLTILKTHNVKAYICGHTHSTSVAKVKGIWQADSGQSRGAADPGTPSTFLKVRAAGTNAWVDVYRADPNGEHYEVKKTVELR